MKYGIVVDSSCDLMDLENELLDFETANESKVEYCRVPLKIEVGEKEFIDDENLNVETMIEEVCNYNGKTGSAAPAPADYVNAYDKADKIIVITISGNLSGSYNSAVVAKDIALEDEPNKKIFVLDSKATGPKMTFLVRRIIKDIKENMEFEDLVRDIEAYTKKIELFFILESVDNLVKNGRISKITSGIVGLLGIKILGCASKEGTIEMLTKSRGKNSIYEKTLEQMIDRGYKGTDVIISHCFNAEKTEYIKQLIKSRFPKANITIMPTRGLCSYYAEKGGIVIGFE